MNIDSENIRKEYVAAVAEHGAASLGTQASVQAANEAYEASIIALHKLRATPDRGEAILKELLQHENSDVRCAAATHLLPIDEAAAIAALSEVAEGPTYSESGSHASFNAYMVLREWKDGRLEIP